MRAWHHIRVVARGRARPARRRTARHAAAECRVALCTLRVRRSQTNDRPRDRSRASYARVQTRRDRTDT